MDNLQVMRAFQDLAWVTGAAGDLAVAPAVALAIYVTTTILAIYKPWGRAPYGERMAAARRR
jgi:hypothetical protein